MSKPLLKHAPPDFDDGTRVEDQFRRVAFNWVMSTKRLIEMSNSLGSTKVAHPALVDIEHGSELLGMLDKLFIPVSNKVSVSAPVSITASSVKSSVAAAVERLTHPLLMVSLDDAGGVKSVKVAKLDLSAPVRAKGGKMLWAESDCPACPSKAHERCRAADGTFKEKPHEERKSAPSNED